MKIYIRGEINAIKETNVVCETDIKKGIGYESSCKEVSILDYDEISMMFCQILKEERVMTE